MAKKKQTPHVAEADWNDIALRQTKAQIRAFKESPKNRNNCR